MKVKNKKYIIGFISSLLLISSILVLVPIINNSIRAHTKNSILLDTSSKYKTKSISNNNKNNAELLLNTLNYVKEYIAKTVIQKQEFIKVSILGGRINKNDRTSKKYKESTIGWLSHNIKRINRFSLQTKATIDNSNRSLKSENDTISKIISLIKEHPYNYETYLNTDGYIIPNLNFLIKNNNLSNNLHYKISNISSNIFDIKKTNDNLNSVSINSEEATISAKALSSTGKTLTNSLFRKTSFNANILTFNSYKNTYQYATTTSINQIYSMNANPLLKNRLSESNNDKALLDSYNSSSDLFIINQNRTILTQSCSLSNGSFANNVGSDMRYSVVPNSSNNSKHETDLKRNIVIYSAAGAGVILASFIGVIGMFRFFSGKKPVDTPKKDEDITEQSSEEYSFESEIRDLETAKSHITNLYLSESITDLNKFAKTIKSKVGRIEESVKNTSNGDQVIKSQILNNTIPDVRESLNREYSTIAQKFNEELANYHVLDTILKEMEIRNSSFIPNSDMKSIQGFINETEELNKRYIATRDNSELSTEKIDLLETKYISITTESRIKMGEAIEQVEKEGELSVSSNTLEKIDEQASVASNNEIKPELNTRNNKATTNSQLNKIDKVSPQKSPLSSDAETKLLKSDVYDVSHLKIHDWNLEDEFQHITNICRFRV